MKNIDKEILCERERKIFLITYRILIQIFSNAIFKFINPLEIVKFFFFFYDNLRIIKFFLFLPRLVS